MARQRDDSPLYIFDSMFEDDKRSCAILHDYAVPPYFKEGALPQYSCIQFRGCLGRRQLRKLSLPFFNICHDYRVFAYQYWLTQWLFVCYLHSAMLLDPAASLLLRSLLRPVSPRGRAPPAAVPMVSDWSRPVWLQHAHRPPRYERVEHPHLRAQAVSALWDGMVADAVDCSLVCAAAVCEWRIARIEG